jgi:hypothetical protein
MAAVRLYRDETDEFELPAVCMKCGAQATAWKSKTFSWHPPWVYVLILAGLLPFAVVALALTQRRTLQAPLCAAHRGHWLWRQLIVIGSFFALLIGGAIAVAVLIEEDGQRRAGDSVAGLLCLGVVGGLVAWIVLAAIAQATSIRAADMTNNWVLLKGVSPVFAEAVEEDRDRYEEEREAAAAERRRDRWRPRPRRPTEESEE